MFDSADAYSAGMAEEILGQAIKGRRDQVIISTKSAFRVGPGPNDVGSSRLPPDPGRRGQPAAARHRLHRPLPAPRLRPRRPPSRRRSARSTTWCRAGKIRYIGCSNFSGWHLMKSLAVSERYGLARYVAHQAYYSLVGRDYEWELMPLALDQGVGCVAWSPLGSAGSRARSAAASPCPRPAGSATRTRRRAGPPIPDDTSSGSSTPSTRWPRRRARPCRRSRSTGCSGGRAWRTSSSAPATRSSSARTSGAVGWELTPEQVARLDAASADDARLSDLAPAALCRSATRRRFERPDKFLAYSWMNRRPSIRSDGDRSS